MLGHKSRHRNEKPRLATTRDSLRSNEGLPQPKELVNKQIFKKKKKKASHSYEGDKHGWWRASSGDSPWAPCVSTCQRGPGRRKSPRTQTWKQTPVNPLRQVSLAPSPPSRLCFPIPEGRNWKRTLALPCLRTQSRPTLHQPDVLLLEHVPLF